MWEVYCAELFFPHFFSLWEVYDFLERLGFEWGFVLSGACWFFTWECLVNPLSKYTSALYLMHGGGTSPAAAHFYIMAGFTQIPSIKGCQLPLQHLLIMLWSTCGHLLHCGSLFSLPKGSFKHPHECKWKANHMMDENTLLRGIQSPACISLWSWWNCLHALVTGYYGNCDGGRMWSFSGGEGARYTVGPPRPPEDLADHHCF